MTTYRNGYIMTKGKVIGYYANGYIFGSNIFTPLFAIKSYSMK